MKTVTFLERTMLVSAMIGIINLFIFLFATGVMTQTMQPIAAVLGLTSLGIALMLFIALLWQPKPIIIVRIFKIQESGAFGEKYRVMMDGGKKYFEHVNISEVVSKILINLDGRITIIFDPPHNGIECINGLKGILDETPLKYSSLTETEQQNLWVEINEARANALKKALKR